MVYVFLADGFEEIEAIVPIDVLRRAGLEVKTVGVQRSSVTGAHGITVDADILLRDADKEKMTMLVLPGGMPGAATLSESEGVRELVMHAMVRDVLIGAICAAPMVLGRMGLLRDRRAVCFPGFEKELTGAIVQKDEQVAADRNIVTGKGPGAAFEFAFRLAEIACGWKKAEELRRSMQYRGHEHALT